MGEVTLYAAIAYTPATGAWSTAACHDSIADAEKAARRLLKKERSPIVTAYAGGTSWIALAIAEDGSWAFGHSGVWFASLDKAKATALKRVGGFTNSPAEVECWVQGGVGEEPEW